MENIKHILYVGLNDKDTKQQKITTLEAYKIVENTALQYVSGATIHESRGIYTHDNGTIIRENSLIVELFDCTELQVRIIANTLKTALNQESIGYEKVKNTTRFI